MTHLNSAGLLTDLIIAISLIYFMTSGWRRGFVYTIIGPLSLVASFFVAEIYFLKTQNIIVAFFIFIFGPIILTILLSSSLTLWNKTVNGNLPPFLISRLLGCVFNLAWGSIIMALLLIFITIIPSRIEKFHKVQEEITRSFSYSLIQPFVEQYVPLVTNMNNLLEIVQDPDKLAKLQSTPEYEAIFYDKKIQDILSDKETAEQIKSKDILKMLTNPKILSLFQDPELMKKMIQLKEAIEKNEAVLKSPTAKPSLR